MKIRTYPLLFTDCQNSVGKYFLDGGGRAIPPPRVAEDPQTPGLNRVNTEFGLPTRVFVFPVVQWQLNPINLNQGSQLEVNLSPTFIKRIKLSFNIWETSKATITCKWRKCGLPFGVLPYWGGSFLIWETNSSLYQVIVNFMPNLVLLSFPCFYKDVQQK